MKVEPAVRKVLFLAAAGLSSAEERRVFLEEVCREDPGLRKHLEELLELQRSADTLFDLPPEMHPEMAESDEEGLGASIGRYRLIERIGEGGCGVVYLAEQQEPVRRKVALKIVRLGMDTENVIARFAAERQALALMDHPNIARVLDAGATSTGRPYFVMELVDGERVTEFCRTAALGIRERLELFVRICQAIQHAHQKGIIHRDIKPSNVLVRWHDGVPVPKVIDFGIAKAAAGESADDVTFTQVGHFIGTPAYMSPEQASGSTDIDTRSDIYSLGALLYELVCGKPPFDSVRLTSGGHDEVRRILQVEEPVPPSLVAGRDKVGELDWIVLKAMRKERQQRYDTANGLAIDVRRFLDDEPVAAGPPGRRYRLEKLIRRNKATFAAAAIALFGLVSGLGISTWLFVREKHAREELSRLHRVAEAARANETWLREAAEYRLRTAQAAVLLGRGEIEEADRLLAGIPAGRTPVSLEAADTFRRIADWHVQGARWNAASARYLAAMHALSSVDDSENYTISFNMIPAGTAASMAGDTAGYEMIRAFAVDRFAATTEPQFAEQTLKTALLKPAGKNLLGRLDHLCRLVEEAVEDPQVWIANDPYLAAWSCFAVGLKYFREGNDSEASRWLLRSLSYPDGTQARIASVRFALAMIETHKGDKVAARNLIELSRGEVESRLMGEISLGSAPEGFWFDWVNAKLLLDEALAKLGS